MTKSSNTHGNPYHDKEGKFTSSDSAGEKKALTEGDVFSNIEFDPDNIDSFLDSFVIEEPKSSQYKKCETNQEAEQLANSILGEGVATYGNSDIRMANKMNEALFNVHGYWPNIFEGVKLFGQNEPKVQFAQMKQIMIKAISSKTNIPDEFAEIVINNTSSLNKVLKKSFYENSVGLVGGLTASSFGILVLNPVSGYDKLKNSFSYNNKSLHDGEYKNGILWTTYHEIGHLFSNWIKRHSGENSIKDIHDLRSFTLKHHVDNTTSYGATSDDEFASEAFADVMLNGNKATKANQECVKIMRRIYSDLTGTSITGPKLIGD